MRVKVTRRAVAVAAMSVMAGAAIASFSPYRRRPANVTLLYVGADDCAPCRNWQNGEAVAFRHAPEYARVIYREVKASALFDILKDAHWPEDLRQYRDLLGRGDGVPLWLVIADNEVVLRGSGASQWQTTVLPKLRALL